MPEVCLQIDAFRLCSALFEILDVDVPQSVPWWHAPVEHLACIHDLSPVISEIELDRVEIVLISLLLVYDTDIVTLRSLLALDDQYFAIIIHFYVYY